MGYQKAPPLPQPAQEQLTQGQPLADPDEVTFLYRVEDGMTPAQDHHSDDKNIKQAARLWAKAQKVASLADE